MTNDLIGVLENATLEVNVSIIETGPRGPQGEQGDKGDIGVVDYTGLATETYVDTGLDLKADKTYVDTQDLLKADKATTYTKTEVDTSLGLKANKQQEEWITPTLLNGATFGSLPFRYRKNQFNQLEFKGELKTLPANFETIMTLPTSHRPSHQVTGVCIGNGFFARVRVSSIGNVEMVYGTFTSYANFDGVTLPLD